MSRLARAAGLVSAATLVSRVLGLLRDAVRAALVGARGLSDALSVAFKIPNLLRDLFAEGAFAGAFVPTLSRVKAEHGDAAAFKLLNRALATLLVYVGLVVVGLVVFAEPVVRLMTAENFEKRAVFPLTVILVRLLAPFLLFICLAVAAQSALNVFGRFFVPALSPALQNLTLVAGGFLLLSLGQERVEAAFPWACLLLAGGALQFFVQVPALWRVGWRPRFEPDLGLRTPEARRIVRRMLPVAGGLAAAHVSILVNTWIATETPGGDSTLYYAFRLVHLPVGLVGVAVGTVVLAQASAKVVRGDEDGVRATLSEGLLLSLALSMPAFAGLLALGPVLAEMLFHWGNLKPDEAAAIGTTIRWFAPAVVFYCSVKVVVPAFYARGDVRGPLKASLVAVAVNLACALSLKDLLSYRALALAVGCGQAANLAVLLALLKRRDGGGGPGLTLRIAKVAAAAAACGAVAWAATHVLPGGSGAVSRIARGLLSVLAGAAAYIAAGWLLRSSDIAALRRLGRRTSA